MSNSHIDNLVNAVTNKISTVVNNHNSSSNAHSSILSNYLQTTDVKDNLTSTDTNKPLSAKQGKELKALIDAKEDNIEIFTGSVDRVNSTSAFLKAYTTSSILEGKIILYKVPDISSIEQTTNVALDYYANNQTTSFYRKYVYKNGVQLTFGDIESNSWILLAYDGTLTNGQWNLISSSSYAEANHTHSNYLTSHQDISGKENISNKTSNWNNTPNDTRYPTEKLVKDSLDGKADNNHTHEVLLSSNDDSDIQLFNVSAQGYPQGEGQPLGAFLSEFWKKIYPVGSIYMSVNSTSPQTLFGGTWEQIQDRFLLASGSTYSAGSTGGSADATLVSHYHGVSTTGEYFVTSSKDSANNTRVAYTSSGNRLVDGQTDTGNSSFHHRQYTTTQGSNGTGKNMPPYLSVYVWKRTA